VHVTMVKRFHPTGCTGLKYRPPREPVELDEEDELAEELGGAPRTMEPPDQMRTGVPIRYADDGAEEEMVEFPARAAESGAESDMGTANGAGPLVEGTGAPDSRPPPPPNPPVKRAVSHRSSDGSSDDAGLPARRQRPRRGSNPSGAGRSIGSGTPMSRPMPCRPEKREAPYGPSDDTTDDMDQTVRRKPRKGRKREDQPEPEPGGSGRPVRSTRWQVLTAPRKTDHGPYRPTVPGTDESMSSDEGLNVIEEGASTTNENQLTILGRHRATDGLATGLVDVAAQSTATSRAGRNCVPKCGDHWEPGVDQGVVAESQPPPTEDSEGREDLSGFVFSDP